MYPSVINQGLLINGEYPSVINQGLLTNGEYPSVINQGLLTNGEYPSVINQGLLTNGEYWSVIEQGLPTMSSTIYIYNKHELTIKHYNDLSKFMTAVLQYFYNMFDEAVIFSSELLMS